MAKAAARKTKAPQAGSSVKWSEQSLDRDAQHSLRKAALLRTAARTFRELGYYATSVEELARRLNVTKPTLYYYVKDKDEILLECQRLAFEYIKEALDEAQSADLLGLDKLQRFLRSYAGLMTSDFGACLILTGLRPLKPESRVVLQRFAQQLDYAVRGILEAGIKDGSIRACNVKLTTFAIFGGYQGIARWFRADGECGLPEIADVFAGLFIRGLEVKPNTGDPVIPPPTDR